MFTKVQEVTKNVEVVFGGQVRRFNTNRVTMSIISKAEGVTNGWVANYLPINGNNGLFDSEGLHSVDIPNFSTLGNEIIASYQNFVNKENRQNLIGLDRSVFENEENKLRFTVTARGTSAYVAVTVLDEGSPFFMMTIPFVVGPDTNNPGNLYIVGTNKLYNQETDTFRNINAYLAPEKKRALYVNYSKQHSSQTINAQLRVNQMNQVVGDERSIAITGGDFEYLQKVNSKYKAMAMVVEFELLEYAFSQYGSVVGGNSINAAEFVAN